MKISVGTSRWVGGEAPRLVSLLKAAEALAEVPPRGSACRESPVCGM